MLFSFIFTLLIMLLNLRINMRLNKTFSSLYFCLCNKTLFNRQLFLFLDRFFTLRTSPSLPTWVCRRYRRESFKRKLIHLGASNATSFLVSLLIALVLFASMQVFRTQIASTAPLTIAGGFLGSLVFISLLTVGNKLDHVSVRKVRPFSSLSLLRRSVILKWIHLVQTFKHESFLKVKITNRENNKCLTDEFPFSCCLFVYIIDLLWIGSSSLCNHLVSLSNHKKENCLNQRCFFFLLV